MIVRKTAVFVSGRGSNMDALIKASVLPSSSYSVSVVLSDKSEADALKKAESYGIPVEIVDYSSHKNRAESESEIIERLNKYDIDFIILAGFMKLLGKTILSRYRGKILNIHPSLLPSFKGLHAQKQALDYGVKFSGCTVHIVDEGKDTGPILAQKVVPVEDDDTEETLSDRILKKEHELYPETVDKFARYEFVVDGRRCYRRKYASTPEKLKQRFSKLHFGKDYESEIQNINRIKKPKLIVSACLAGIPCRYDGKSKRFDFIDKLGEEYEIIPICPEVLSGLSIPRSPMEFKGGDGKDLLSGKVRLFNENGEDISEQMKTGAERAFDYVQKIGAKMALLKARSPSCGLLSVYSHGKLISGSGVFASFLLNSEIECIDEEHITV